MMSDAGGKLLSKRVVFRRGGSMAAEDRREGGLATISLYLKKSLQRVKPSGCS